MIQILTSKGAAYISDRRILEGNRFPVISEYRKTEWHLERGIAVLLDTSDRFSGQRFSPGTVGICAGDNEHALRVFLENRIPVITCGLNAKNTVTLSSFEEGDTLVTLQRKLIALDGSVIEPGEFRVRNPKNYAPLTVMYCTAVFLLFGSAPDSF